jgi:hypothetical protein
MIHRACELAESSRIPNPRLQLTRRCELDPELGEALVARRPAKRGAFERADIGFAAFEVNLNYGALSF